MTEQLREKVRVSIQRFQDWCPPDGFYLAFSGGKDSVVIKRLAEMAGVPFDAHYQNTSVDPPELVRFIMDQHPDVHREYPVLIGQMSFDDILDEEPEQDMENDYAGWVM